MRERFACKWFTNRQQGHTVVSWRNKSSSETVCTVDCKGRDMGGRGHTQHTTQHTTHNTHWPTKEITIRDRSVCQMDCIFEHHNPHPTYFDFVNQCLFSFQFFGIVCFLVEYNLFGKSIVVLFLFLYCLHD